ncbi:MAG: ABC transporter permease [Deltaproteobacteria bacterium]|nr:ABC transporter permease [Deltaproteobacteria bacterium]
MNTFKLAWRNVWRNARRSIVTVIAMALALFAMVQYAGFMRGYQTDLANSAVNIEMGDLQIHGKGYLEKPTLYKNISNANALVSQIERIAPGVYASARILGSGLIASDHNSAPAMFKGVEAEKDKRVSDVCQHVSAGKWLSPKDSHGVVIGAQLARILNVRPGDELIFLSQAADGSAANELFHLRGTVTGAGSDVERAQVFMNKDTLARFLNIKNAHQILVRTSGAIDNATLQTKIRTLAPTLDVKTWQEISPELASMIAYMSTALVFMSLLVYIAIGIVVLNAMLMAVFERIREFGIMKAIGVSPLGVFRIIVAETAVLLMCSIVVGMIISLPVGYSLATHGIDLSSQMSSVSVSGVGVSPVMKAVFDIKTILTPVALLAAVVFISILYPALKASLLQPISAIHHQ